MRIILILLGLCFGNFVNAQNSINYMTVKKSPNTKVLSFEPANAYFIGGESHADGISQESAKSAQYDYLEGVLPNVRFFERYDSMRLVDLNFGVTRLGFNLGSAGFEVSLSDTLSWL